MVEGAPLLRAYRFIPIEGSNPSLSAINKKRATRKGGPFFMSADSSDLVRTLRFDKLCAQQSLDAKAKRRRPKGLNAGGNRVVINPLRPRPGLQALSKGPSERVALFYCGR